MVHLFPPSPGTQQKGSPMALVYATTEDLGEDPWSISPAPSNAGRLLWSASRLVRHATMTARYATDSDGYPTDEVKREAMRQATCAQVSAWLAAEIDPASGGVQATDPVLASKSLGSGSFSYDTSASGSVTAMTARSTAATVLTQEAYLILQEAGLASPRPGTYR